MITIDPRMPPPPTTSSDPRWQQVLNRDAAADGRFVYAVSTTGVYCRPSCASRQARAEHVSFFHDASEAERAGFRACRRCQPDRPALVERQRLMIAELCRFMDNAAHVPGLTELGQRAGLSPHYLQRLFKAFTGVTPRAYAAACRAERLRRRLDQGDSVTVALHEAGYGSSSRLYAEADAVLGMQPSARRVRGQQVEIRFAVGQCWLGAILVAQSERGVCAILIGDDPEALLDDLQHRFRDAKLIGADAAFEQRVAVVVGFVEQPHLGLDLPLDVRGTVFQQRVWQALCAIPPGETVSYSELARRIGAPRAIRAVAGACAANVLAVAIPCHRVVRSDGGLSGYRWGLERKQALLEREAANVPSTGQK